MGSTAERWGQPVQGQKMQNRELSGSAFCTVNDVVGEGVKDVGGERVTMTSAVEYNW